jgi:predicted NAD/FAD-binding protein
MAPSNENGIINGGANGVTSEVNNNDDRATICIPLHQQNAYQPRKLRVVTIGAGYSGLTLAHKLRYQHPEVEEVVTHTIFESRPDIGGTWLVNTYPGVQCDVPSHIYVRTNLSYLKRC